MAVIHPLIIAPHLLWGNEPVALVERPLFSHLSGEVFNPVYLCDNLGNPEIFRDDIQLVRVSRKAIMNNVIRVLSHTFMREAYNCPDKDWYVWCKKALKMAEKIIDRGEIDYIHTCSNPASDHLMGLYLKRKYGLPWVAQLFDPWYGSPYRNYKKSKYRDRDKKWEAAVAHEADVIILYCDAMRDLWISRYGEVVEPKIKVLPMASEFPKEFQIKGSEGKLTISHIGNLYGGRTARPFIEAVDELRKEIPELKDLLRVNFIGYIQASDSNLIKSNNMMDIFNLPGKLNPDECQMYYETSDIFLCIDADDRENNYFFPSKLMNYFFYRKPIIGITPDNSVVYHELKNAGHHSFQNSDVGGIANYIKKALANRSLIESFDMNYWEQFSPTRAAAQYEAIITSRIRDLSFSAKEN